MMRMGNETLEQLYSGLAINRYADNLPISTGRSPILRSRREQTSDAPRRDVHGCSTPGQATH
jgi:hypothetical protein